jgi:hypothetical protein
MQRPRTRCRCKSFRNAYRSTSADPTITGIARTTKPRAISVLVRYAAIATAAVSPTPDRSSDRNSSGPAPK